MGTEAMTEEKRARGIALCRKEAERWLGEASLIRDHAARPHLDDAVRAILLRNAAWCEDTAVYWEAGARDYET